MLSKWIDKRIAAYQQGLIAMHYAEVENMYNKIRGFKHDYRNHIQAMKGHAANRDLDAIAGYLDGLDAELDAIEPVIKTGNRMADAILNSKISLANAKGIKVAADANIAVELTVSEVDLCIILGNLLDNAMEACLNLEEDKRLIRVFMEMKNTQLYISVTNTAPGGKQRKYGKRHLSTKGDGHGFGLARIDHIVERHGGYLSRNSEDGAYSTEVLLPQG